ncbi:MAG: hypothetical protein C5B49_11940 [Bdellovibrio sp.]|nr:MAG: hypothetical protein C5B49_11940 [Bdellovibrio sp.]
MNKISLKANIRFLVTLLLLTQNSLASSQSCDQVHRDRFLSEVASDQTVPDTSAGSQLAAVKHWQSEALKAHQEGRREGEIYALLKLGLTTQNLSRADRSSIKRSLFNLELMAFEKDPSLKKNSRNLVSFFGFNYFFQPTVFGVRPYSALRYRLKSLPTLAADLFFTIGPVMASGQRRRYMDVARFADLARVVVPVAQRHGLLTRFAEMNNFSVEESASRLRDQAQQVDQSLRAQSENAWYYGRSLIPLIAAALIMVAQVPDIPLMPWQFLQAHADSFIPKEYRSMTGQQFLADVENQIGSLQNGRLLIAYSDALFPALGQVKDLPLKLSEFSKYQSDRLKLVEISSLSELTAREDLGVYDNIIIFSHGGPDAMGVGLQATHFGSQLKERANVIFYACLIGQKGSHHGQRAEAWVEFAKSLLRDNGGKAIVATQAINVDPHNRLMREVDGRTYAAHVFSGYLGYGSGFIQAQDVIKNVIQAAADDYYFDPGIRVYDSKTGQTTLVPTGQY